MAAAEIPTFKLVLGKLSPSAHPITLTAECPNCLILVLSRDRSMIQHYFPHNIHVRYLRRVVGDGGTGKTTFVKVLGSPATYPVPLTK
jgi:hypothetical protein